MWRRKEKVHSIIAANLVQLFKLINSILCQNELIVLKFKESSAEMSTELCTLVSLRLHEGPMMLWITSQILFTLDCSIFFSVDIDSVWEPLSVM